MQVAISSVTSSPESQPILRNLNYSTFADMSSIDLEGLSREEKIKKLKASIASLEEESKKQEEDRELQQLLNKHEELTRKLSQSSNSKNSKPMLSEHETELKVNEITKSVLPSITGIQNLLHVSEKRTKAKKDKKRKKRSHKFRWDRDSSDEDSSEVTSEEMTSVIIGKTLPY